MKAESTIKPKSYSVEQCGGIAEVVLYENIEQTTRKNENGENEKYFAYDEYRISIPFRENLSAEIAANRNAWLEAAIDAEKNIAEQFTLEERIAQLIKDNEALKNDNEIMGAALEEVIAVVVGGE